MNPGIFYLYEYSNNKKLRNVGFLKIQLHYHNCQMQVHARGIPVKTGDSITLFAFFVEKSVPVSFKLTEITCANNCTMGKLSFAESEFPDSKKLSDMAGFFLRTNGNRFYVAAPSEIEFNTEQITAWEKPAVLPNKTEADAPEPIEDTEPAEEEPVVLQSETKLESAEQTEDPAPISSPNETAGDTFTPVEEQQLTDARQPSPQTQTDSQPQSAPQHFSQTQPAAPITAQKQEVQESETTSKSSGRKIQRSDLTILPRRCWNLANNSFLMHGYHNYNHLLLVEEEGHYWLGVPGIYAPREAKAAELFGFPQFTKSYVPHLELSEEERDSSEDFGHWCRYIR